MGCAARFNRKISSKSLATKVAKILRTPKSANKRKASLDQYYLKSDNAVANAILSKTIICSASNPTPLANQTVVGLRLVANTTNDTCDITGTPNTLGDHPVYIRATSTKGGFSAVLPLVLTVNPKVPVLTYTDNPRIHKARALGGSVINPIVFTNTGGAVASCMEGTPSLPQGLMFSKIDNTCQITGTPMAVATIQTYTITGINVTESDTAMVSITINPKPRLG